jgi:hypothetical protein
MGSRVTTRGITSVRGLAAAEAQPAAVYNMLGISSACTAVAASSAMAVFRRAHSVLAPTPGISAQDLPCPQVDNGITGNSRAKLPFAVRQDPLLKRNGTAVQVRNLSDMRCSARRQGQSRGSSTSFRKPSEERQALPAEAEGRRNTAPHHLLG